MIDNGLHGGQYRPLKKNQILKLHETALIILEQIGFTYESGLEEMLEMLEKSGASVDRTHSRILFPRKLVMEQVSKAPNRIILYSRDGKNDLDIEGDRVYLGTGGAAIKILDIQTGELRNTTLRDLYDLGRLVDELDNIHFFLRPCIPKDIPESLYDENVFYTCLKATGKHVMAGVNNVKGFYKMLDIAAIVAGDTDKLKKRPFVSVIASFAISPLKLCTQSMLILQESVRHRIPAALSCAPMTGSTSPITMAGTLAQTHAEQLAGIAICQMISPGCPILYGGIPGMANLRNLGYLGGAIECGIMNAAIHQLANFIGIPNYNSAGITEAKIPDAQAGWEKGMNILLAAMGGSNYVHHAAGMLDSMIAVAYEQFVIDDEIIGRSCKVLKEIDMDADHLALEVIKTVGPGNNFIKTAHTAKYMRTEYFNGNGISDQKNRHRWAAQGSRDTWKRAGEIVKKILSEPEKTYLAPDIDLTLRNKYDIRL